MADVALLAERGCLMDVFPVCLRQAYGGIKVKKESSQSLGNSSTTRHLI